MLPQRTLIVCSLVLSLPPAPALGSRPVPSARYRASPLDPACPTQTSPPCSRASPRTIGRHGWTSAECQHVGRGFADVRALVLLAALELERARELAPLRPDVDYNRALFALARVRTLTGVDDARALEEARTAFERFVHKADGAPQYASDVAQAQEHLADLRDTLRFVHPESQ